MASRAPAGLQRRGRLLWRRLQEEYEFADRELDLVLETCKSLDTIDSLEEVLTRDGTTTTGSMGQTVVHPAVAEVRQQRAAYARLLLQLGLEDAEFASNKSARQAAGRAAAQKRWREQQGPPRATSA